MKIRALNLALALLLAGSVFSPAVLAVPQADDDKDKGPVKKIGVASVEKRSKLLQDRWKGLRSGPIERRILLIHEFANAPCKETVDFLVKLYGSEKNSGIHMSITQTLGKIGTEQNYRLCTECTVFGSTKGEYIHPSSPSDVGRTGRLIFGIERR